MRRDNKSIFLKNVYFITTVLALVSCFIGCTAGSCLSYGHSCWGAHGKRSGFGRVLLNPERRVMVDAPPIRDDGWILQRFGNRQSSQLPLAVRMRAKLLSEEPFERSTTIEKLSRDYEVRGIPKDEQRMTEAETSDVIFNSDSKDLNDDGDQAIKIGLYKILKNIDEKSK